MNTNGHEGRLPDGRARRLVRHLGLVGCALDRDRPRSEERLIAILGHEQLRAVRDRIEEVEQVEPAAGKQADRPPAVTALPRLRRWQWSVFFAALGCGAAVAIVGLIDLVWNLRAVLGGLGAVAVVVLVYSHTRHLRAEEDWIAS